MKFKLEEVHYPPSTQSRKGKPRWKLEKHRKGFAKAIDKLKQRRHNNEHKD